MSRGLQLVLDGIAELRVETATGTFHERLLASKDTERIVREVDLTRVQLIGDLLREGGFAAVGYTSPVNAISDLWNINRTDARQYVNAAEHLRPRITLDGTVLPPRLPVCAAAFETGLVSLRHVEVIAKVLGSDEASRLDDTVCGGVEQQLVDQAGGCRPTELHTRGMDLVRMLDQDGPEPDDKPSSEVNEVTITRHPDRPGGTIKGRFDNALMFDQIATVIDAKATPTTGDDHRGTGLRQAEALADICGYVLDHGEVPACGGRRPHVNVLIPLVELERRARTAMLDFGGTISPSDLRMLACNATVIPIVMGGESQPLDIGRATRVIPDGLRRAVAARDRGCARCGRPASWCEIHHIAEWENGGATEIGNLVMLCRTHHRELHNTEWVVRIVDGLPEFIPPKWVDPQQIPRRRPRPPIPR